MNKVFEQRMYILTRVFGKIEAFYALLNSGSSGFLSTFVCRKFHKIFAHFRHGEVLSAVWAWKRTETFRHNPHIRIARRRGCVYRSHAGQHDLFFWRSQGSKDRRTCVLLCEQRSCACATAWPGGRFDHTMSKDVAGPNPPHEQLIGGNEARSPKKLWHYLDSQGKGIEVAREHSEYVVWDLRSTWTLSNIESIGEVWLHCGENWHARPAWIWRSTSWHSSHTGSPPQPRRSRSRPRLRREE